MDGYTVSSVCATAPSCIDLPEDFDPKSHRILATHWFGLEPRDVREVYWNQVRFGHRLPTQLGVIVFDRGQR